MCSFGGGSKSPSSSSSSSNRSKSSSQAVTQKMGRDYSGIRSSGPSAKDTFMMDIGLKEKTSDYYSALSGRQERSRAAMESMLSSSGSDDKSSTPAPTPTPAAAAAAAPAPAPTPPPVPTDGSAPGAEESKVVEGAKTRKGRASTVQTDMQGLLTAAKTRRRRSLMAGAGEGSSGLIS